MTIQFIRRHRLKTDVHIFDRSQLIHPCVGSFYQAFVVTTTWADWTIAHQYLFTQQFLTYPSKLIPILHRRGNLFSLGYAVQVVVYVKMHIRYLVLTEQSFFLFGCHLLHKGLQTHLHIQALLLVQTIYFKTQALRIKIKIPPATHSASHTLTLLVQ